MTDSALRPMEPRTVPNVKQKKMMPRVLVPPLEDEEDEDDDEDVDNDDNDDNDNDVDEDDDDDGDNSDLMKMMMNTKLVMIIMKL